MDLKLFALTCGYLTGDLGYLMEGGEGKAELPKEQVDDFYRREGTPWSCSHVPCFVPEPMARRPQLGPIRYLLFRSS